MTERAERPLGRRQLAARVTWMMTVVCAVGVPGFILVYNWAALGIPPARQGFEIVAVSLKALVVIFGGRWLAIRYLRPVFEVLRANGDDPRGAPVDPALLQHARARAADFPWVFYGGFVVAVSVMAFAYDLVFVRRAGGPPLQTGLIVAFGEFGYLLLTGAFVYVAARRVVRPFLESPFGHGVRGARYVSLSRRVLAISVSLNVWVLSMAVSQIAFMVWAPPVSAAAAAAVARSLAWGAFALLMIAWIGAQIASDATRDVRFVTEKLRRLATEPYGERPVLQATSADEVGDLVDAYNQVLAAVERRERDLRAAELRAVEAERARLEADVRTAREVQRSLLPPPLAAPSLEAVGYFRPATELGGDFLDYFALPDGRVALAIGDVMGHGVGAALQMAMVKSYLRAAARIDPSPAPVLSGLNRLLFELPARGRMTTFWYGLVTADASQVVWGNAGHPFPLLRTLHGCRSLDGAALPLGVEREHEPALGSTALMPGESLVLFTDGVVEAMRGAGMLGFDGLERAVRHWNGASPSELADLLLGPEETPAAAPRVAEASGRAARHADDAALVVLRRVPASAPPAQRVAHQSGCDAVPTSVNCTRSVPPTAVQ